MSLRQKAGKISRRSKQASTDTVTSASASHARENSANRSDGNTKKSTSALPTEVKVTPATPPLPPQMNDIVNNDSRSHMPGTSSVTGSSASHTDGITKHGAGSESDKKSLTSDMSSVDYPGSQTSTASPSEVSVRYSLTQGTSSEHPDLTGTQVNLDTTLRPENTHDDTLAKLDDNNNDHLALVPAGSYRDQQLLKPYVQQHEGDSSSDDSSNSPRSAGDEHRQLDIVRTGSKTDSSDASSSIAVDCHTGPSEVIVKGKNVKKIRVKFPQPQPPNDDTYPTLTNNDRLPPKSGRYRRQSSMYRSQGSQPQEHGDDVQEGGTAENSGSATSSQSHDQANARALYSHPLNSARVLPGIQGYRVGPVEQASPGIRDSGVSIISGASGMSVDAQRSNGASQFDERIKLDMLNGIQYFENQTRELRDQQNRMLAELECAQRLNDRLEDRLKLTEDKLNTAEIRIKELVHDNCELKIKLDQREKETDRSKEQERTQWQARVKADELFMELKRDSDIELRRLKDQLSAKEKEMAQFVSAAGQKEKAIRNSLKEPGIANKSLRANMEDHLELLHKISRLEEEITKLKSENEKEKVMGRKSKDEAEMLRGKLKDHNTELDSQYKRFLSLKKNFNDLREEHDKLKLQLRTRRSVNPNNTWPKNAAPNADVSSKPSEIEAVSYFDIPTKFGAKSNSPVNKKLGKPLLEHKRTPSEGRSVTSENLPPVTAAPFK